MPVVYPVMKRMSYPTIGVEFTDLNYTEREMVSRFMFRTERKIVQIEKNRPTIASSSFQRPEGPSFRRAQPA